MAKNSGLGKGLDALFADNAVSGNGYELINIDDITPNRDQPRQDFDQDSLEELANSIKNKGVLQPLIVRPIATGGYRIIAGERRWRASRIAGLSEVPAVIMDSDNKQADAIALIENLQRENLNPVETAQGCKKLMEDHGLTQELLAEELGMSRSAIANLLRINSLPEKVLDYVRNGSLSFGHAKVLAALPEERCIQIADECVNNDLSVRKCEELAKKPLFVSKKPTSKTRNTLIVESEKLLKTNLGRKVTISGNDKKGKLIIDYCGDGDLIELVNRISK